ncbi:MAG: hypothetical protein OEL50_01995 [Rhodospirillaceae bacterium]|nr:hypothetical protein [Rhodospirillaceae bacterium]
MAMGAFLKKYVLKKIYPFEKYGFFSNNFIGWRRARQSPHNTQQIPTPQTGGATSSGDI